MSPDDMSKALKSVKSHKRYTLRVTSLAANLAGDVLNFVSLIAAFISGDGNAPKFLTVWASIVLGCSFVYNLVDLASHSDHIFKTKYVVPLNVLMFFDMLGFLSYLALIIANAVIVNDLWNGPVMLYSYNSVPWMVTCGVHLIIVFQNLPSLFSNLGNRSTCCAECHHKAKRMSRGDEASRSLLERGGSDDDYQDIEGDAPGPRN